MAIGGKWLILKIILGNIQFEKNAIRLKCLNDGGRIEILDPSGKSEVLVFKYGAQIVILGTTIFYYGNMLQKIERGKLS